MELTLQILVGLATVILLGLGTMSMFAPRRMVKNFAIESIETAGLSTILSFNRHKMGSVTASRRVLAVLGQTSREGT